MKFLLPIICSLILSTSYSAAEDETTQTTKVETICSKCHCVKEKKLLDCAYEFLTDWFTQDQWNQLNETGIEFETVTFAHNKLQNVPVLPLLPSVKKLVLSFNLIDTIAETAFINLPRLETIDLSRNRLVSKNLSPHSFRGNYTAALYEPLQNVRELSLAYNQLHSLDSNLFEHLPVLERLDLTGNVFQVIDRLTENAISSITNLKYLDLSYMELQQIPEHMLHAPRDLETLNISGNLLTELPTGLTYAINLVNLDIDENPIIAIDGENVFPNLTKLEYLSMSYMEPLEHIGKEAFSGLSGLKTLIATNNLKLATIHPYAFRLPQDEDGHGSYPPIEKLYLHNNHLTTIDNNLLERWDRIKLIDLRDNPWSCDCENRWLINDLYAQIELDTPTLTKRLICNAPSQLYGKSIADVHASKSLKQCSDSSDNHSEKDGAILIGVLIGLLVGVPLTLALVLIYRKGCFGMLGVPAPGDYNRAFYRRAQLNDEI